MSELSRPRPLKEAARITQMLDLVLGEDRFDRAPVDVIGLALEYSRQVAPQSPIHEVVERNIPGCVGALVYGEARQAAAERGYVKPSRRSQRPEMPRYRCVRTLQ